jgi:hypothetical protein
MRQEKENRPSQYSGAKVTLATAVLLAPLVAKSVLTVILKYWSKKKN